jgi:hypothetical protein
MSATIQVHPSFCKVCDASGRELARADKLVDDHRWRLSFYVGPQRVERLLPADEAEAATVAAATLLAAAESGDPTARISAAVMLRMAAGASLPAAFDAAIGEGAYARLAADTYDTLRATATEIK